MIKIDLNKMLGLKPISEIMGYEKAHIEDEHRPAIVAAIIKDIATIGSTAGDAYDDLENLKYFLKVRMEIIDMATDEVKDLGFDMARKEKLDPNKLHIK